MESEFRKISEYQYAEVREMATYYYMRYYFCRTNRLSHWHMGGKLKGAPYRALTGELVPVDRLPEAMKVKIAQANMELTENG